MVPDYYTMRYVGQAGLLEVVASGGGRLHHELMLACDSAEHVPVPAVVQPELPPGSTGPADKPRRRKLAGRYMTSRAGGQRAPTALPVAPLALQGQTAGSRSCHVLSAGRRRHHLKACCLTADAAAVGIMVTRCPVCRELQNVARKCVACGAALPTEGLATDGRGPSPKMWAGVALFAALVAVSVAAGMDGSSGGSYSSASSSGDYSAESSGYISAVRGSTSFPDSDFMLEEVGEQVCYEIETIGYSAMRANFAMSSYTSSQQGAIVSAAQSFLC